MDARFLGLDNILSTLGITSTKSFEMWYNSALAGRETQDLNIEGFEWGESQIDFTYDFLEAEGKIKTMATYVDLNSEPVAHGKEVSLSKITGTIPRQKHKIVRGENDYRKQLIALSNADAAARLMGGSPYASVREYLANNLFDTVAEIPDAHSASLSYQVGQMKSKRSLTLTDVNNAGGIVDVSFEANVPDSNVVSDAWYNVGSDGTITYVEDIDPIEVLKKKIREIKWDNYNGYPNVCVEIDEKTFFTLIQHPKVLTKFGYMLHPELRISAKNDDNAKAVGYDAFLATNDAQVKELFRNAIGADVVLYNNTVVGADKLNASTKKFETAKLKAFAEGVVLIRPTGVIGTIRNVVPLRPDGSAISGSIFGGRGIIEYRYNNETRTQTWVSELTVLAVPNQPKKMYYFEIAGTAEVASE